MECYKSIRFFFAVLFFVAALPATFAAPAKSEGEWASLEGVWVKMLMPLMCVSSQGDYSAH